MKDVYIKPTKHVHESSTRQAIGTMMPAHAIEIFLQPGEYYFGDRNTRIRTVLGSCIAITMWHSKLLIGGMCHFMLPSRKRSPKDILDGRYADEAMAMFLRDIAASETRYFDYEVKVFGGGNMFPDIAKNDKDWTANKSKKKHDRDVSHHNTQAAMLLIQNLNFNVQASSVGGAGHRQIYFDIWSGHVWVRHNTVVPNL